MPQISKEDLFPGVESEEDLQGEIDKESEHIMVRPFKEDKPFEGDTGAYVTLTESSKLVEKYNAVIKFSRLVGNTSLEGMSYLSLGCIHYVQGHYDMTIEFFEKAAELGKEIKNTEMERRAYINLATVFEAVGKQDRSLHCRKQALGLTGVNNSRNLKQHCAFYNMEGMLYHLIGNYSKSIRCHEQSLEISTILHDQQGKGTSHFNLGTVFCTFGQYDNAIKHHQKSLDIRNAMGDKPKQGISCTQMAYLYYVSKKYDLSTEYQERALRISREIGANEMETASYSNLGRIHQANGDYGKSVTYYEKWLHSSNGLVGHKKKESTILRHLSDMLHALGRHDEARRYRKRGFSMGNTRGFLREEVFETIEVMEGDDNDRFLIPTTARSHISKLSVTKTYDCLWECIEKHEQQRLALNDEDKVFFDEQIVVLYKAYALQRASLGDTDEALFALEQCRAPALVDLMRKTYNLQKSSNTNSLRIHINTIASLIEKQNCCFLFETFLMKNLASWFISKMGEIRFKPYSEQDPSMESMENLLKTLIRELIEIMEIEDDDMRSREDARKCERLRILHKAIIDPVTNLIEGPEIIIVTEGEMLWIPFAALRDANEVYLSESRRIRLIPSLTALKLIQDSPTDYHCQTGALIVGDPEVGLDDPEHFPPLPAARDEVQTISNLLGVSCLVGEQATKETVLLQIEKVSLVHIAAIGNEERGEPALALSPSFIGEPELDDFVLTIQDIARLRIRAKLVVLSTCYGGRGKVLTGEGVVGIARAFLGSGARSVLMSLWPVCDKATNRFMCTFYSYLKVDKMSASEALHQTQKDMRTTLGFKAEKDWASFVRYGDDVILDL